MCKLENTKYHETHCEIARVVDWFLHHTQII